MPIEEKILTGALVVLVRFYRTQHFICPQCQKIVYVEPVKTPDKSE